MSATNNSDSNPKRWQVALLLVAVALGAWLRLGSIASKSVTHVEMYVPGVHMPAGISVPGERLSLVKVITGTFSSDTHPPGFYLLMWAWTKLFGTSAASIRLPAALLGLACIPLIFWLGVLIGRRAAGAIAALLLAVNGHHIFWSDTARMFTLACCLGLLATGLLLIMARRGVTAPRASAYLVVLLCGLASHVFFWAIFGTQMLWTSLNALGAKRTFAGVLRWQFLGLILGSPLIAFAAYQNGNVVAPLSDAVLVYAREFAQFAFLFPLVGFSSGVYPNQSTVVLTDDPHVSALRWGFVAICALLLIAGIAAMRAPESGSPPLLNDSRGPGSKSWTVAAGAATLAIALFILMAKHYVKPRPNPTLHTAELMLVMPAILALLAILATRWWKQRDFTIRFASRYWSGERALILMLALVPFALLALASLFKPFLNARGMISLAPYLLLVLAAGLVHIFRSIPAAGLRWAYAAAISAVLVTAHVGSVRAYAEMSAGRANYKELALALQPKILPGDLVFIEPSWSSTPIYFYMNAGWSRWVGDGYEDAVRSNPSARVWVLVFYNYNDRLPQAMQAALASLHLGGSVEAPGARALLYLPSREENP